MDIHAAGLYLADQYDIVSPVKSSTYIDEIMTLIHRYSIDFVFPLYSREIGLFAAVQHDLAAAGARLYIPDPQQVALCDDKTKFLKFMNDHDFLFPLTYESLADVTAFPVFIKPVSGSSSVHTYKISNHEELAFYLKQFPNSIIQEFVETREYTVDCLVDREFRVVASVPRERIRVKDGKSVVARTVKNELIVSEVHRLLGALRLSGPCNVQLFYDGSCVKFVEVNPRLAAGGLPLAVEAGVNIPELMVRLSDGEKLDYQEYEDGVVMLRYLSDLFIRD